MLIAEHGVSSGIIADFTIPRDDTSHPLVRAMSAPAPSTVRIERRCPPRSGRGRCRCSTSWTTSASATTDSTPSALRADDESEALGLLLVSADTPESCRTSYGWPRLLARQATRLLSGGPLVDVHFGQERMLLYSIINAVTDPILLTDTEGKLIIANTHAEKLFAAPEEASEGWRRAVGLEQHAVLRGAVDERGRRTLRWRAASCCSSIRSKDPTCCSSCCRSRAKDERQGTCVVSILRNVTDLAAREEEIEESYRTLRLAQAEVRDERHRLDLIIDSVADPILVTDQEGDIVLMNAPAERLFNVPPPRRKRRSGAFGRTAQTSRPSSPTC